jgi:hypothetical protein
MKKIENQKKDPKNFLIILFPLLVLLLALSFLTEKISILYHNAPDYAARASYQVGYVLLTKHDKPDLALVFWRMASFFYPLSGHIWVELASLEKYVFVNDVSAKNYLNQCINSPTQYKGYPASQCSQAIKFFHEIDPPGTLRPHVINGL